MGRQTLMHQLNFISEYRKIQDGGAGGGKHIFALSGRLLSQGLISNNRVL